MELSGWRNYCGLLLMSVVLLVMSAPLEDFSDIKGPYCEIEGVCCSGRQDTCSVPILGTLCYCDDFCNTTGVSDCCPDYWPYCKGIIIPTISPPSTTESCRYYLYNLYNLTLGWKDAIQDNCNECVCTETRDENNRKRLEMLCETNTCLIDSKIIDTVNDEPSYGWTASNYSEFWGRTLDDGVLLRLGTLQPQRFVLNMNPVRRIYDPAALPRTFDSEQKWPSQISGIQDQRWCGSSWAISTAAVASDRYAIVSEGLEQVQLSAQNLLSCDTNGQQSCSGGHLDRAWSFIRKHGLVDEDCFPYVARNERCTIKRKGTLLSSGCNPPKYETRESRYTVGPAYRLGNETDIMNEITRSGPVQATMKVYQDFFSYRGGIYRHTDLALNQKQGYHSVRIVGWGEEITYNGVTKFWRVANSWGRDWGENGYFRILKGTNECEIESFVLGTWPHVEEQILLTNYNEVI